MDLNYVEIMIRIGLVRIVRNRIGRIRDFIYGSKSEAKTLGERKFLRVSLL